MYASMIEDTELIKGDSSEIYFFGVKDGRSLVTNWTGKFTIIEGFGSSPIVERDLPLNSGTGEGDSYTAGTKFIFQISPTETALLTENTKYIVSVRISNSTIPYSSELAQFKLKILPSGI